MRVINALYCRGLYIMLNRPFPAGLPLPCEKQNAWGGGWNFPVFFFNFNWDLIANICHHCWKEFLKISVKLPLGVICWKIKFSKVVEFLQWGARLGPNCTNVCKILRLHGAVSLFVLDLITLSLNLVSFLILRHSFEQCWLIFANWSFLTL